jgi:CTP synthase
MPDAGSSEFGDTKLPLVGLMTEWTVGNETLQRSADDDLGGTMRLGAYECHLIPGSTASHLYGEQVISERHRHRYEVNIAYCDQLEAAGLVISGLSPDGSLPEIVERADHPFFCGGSIPSRIKIKTIRSAPAIYRFCRGINGKIASCLIRAAA